MANDNHFFPFHVIMELCLNKIIITTFLKLGNRRSTSAALTSKYIFNGMIPVSFCIYMPVLLFGSIKAHKLPGIFRYDPVVLPVPDSPPFVLHSYPKRIWKPLSISYVYSFNLSCFHDSSILRCFCSRLCFTFFHRLSHDSMTCAII